MATKKMTIVVEEQYTNLLESLPNKSRIINNLLALLFSNVNESDLMRIAYVINNNESLRKELQNVLQRNMGIELPAQQDKVKSNKVSKQTIKESKEKEPISKKPMSFESWW